MGYPALVALTALVPAVLAHTETFPPHYQNLRGGASSDLVDSLSSLKEILEKLETKVKAPAPSAEPIVVDPQVGDLVRVRPDIDKPKFDWGEASHSSVGRLTWYFEDRCTVDFPTHANWNGLLSELERVSAEEEEEASADAAPAAKLAVGAQVRLRPGAAEPEGGWGAAGPPTEGATNCSSWLGVVAALSDKGDEEVTVVLLTGARWVGVPASLELLEDLDGSADGGDGAGGPRERGGTERDGIVPLGSSRGRRWEPSRRRIGEGEGGRKSPLFSSFGSSFSASSPSSSADVRKARLPVPPGRMPGVPAPTWLGWTLGAAFAQITTSTRPGMASTLGGRRRRRAGSSAGLAGGLADSLAASSAAASASSNEPIDGLARPRNPPLIGVVVVGLARLLSPLFYFATLLGLLLSALSMVLDQPVSTLLDASLHALPALLHALQIVPHQPTAGSAGLVIPQFVRSLVLVPLRLPSVVLLSTMLYLLCGPGFDVLVRARAGFEEGFRAVSSAAPSNAAAGGANRGDADERLQAVLATWGRLIAMVRAARLAALGIAALALIDKAGALQALAAQPPPAGK